MPYIRLGAPANMLKQTTGTYLVLYWYGQWKAAMGCRFW